MGTRVPGRRQSVSKALLRGFGTQSLDRFSTAASTAGKWMEKQRQTDKRRRLQAPTPNPRAPLCRCQIPDQRRWRWAGQRTRAPLAARPRVAFLLPPCTFNLPYAGRPASCGLRRRAEAQRTGV